MKFQFPLNNFTAGEWSNKMIARTDVDEYKNASQSLQNVIVQMQGGAFKRPGLERISVGTTQQGYLNGASKKRIFPWVLSDGSRYVVVATSERPVSGTNPWFIWDEVNKTTHLLSCASTSAYPDTPNTSVMDMQYCQIGDILFFATANGPPMFMRKEGTSFYIRTIQENYLTYIVSGGGGSLTQNTGTWNAFPFGSINSLGSLGTITATGTLSVGGTVNLVASLGIFDSAMSGFDTYFKFTLGGNTGVVTITAVTDSTHAAATVLSALPGSSPAVYGLASGTAWEISAWNPTYGFPRTITAFQGRLLFGGSSKYPDTLWGSETGNIYHFMEVPFAQDPTYTTFATDNTRPFTLAPNSKTSSNIRSLSASKVLVINTDRAEIVAYGSQGSLGPNDVTFESDTFFGSEAVQPVGVNNFLTFVQRGGRKLRDVIFSFQEDQYKSNDLMFLADHITDGDPIKELVSTEMGSSIIWARTLNGNLISVTMDRDYHVNAWTHHVLGGTYMGGSPVVLAIAGLQANYSSSGVVATDIDSLYVLANVTINGSTVTCLTKLARIFDPLSALTLTLNGVQIPEYVDFAEYQVNLPGGVPTAKTTFTFSDYANATVSVIADGGYVGDFTLSNTGVLTLAVAAVSVLIGYKYSMVVKPMPVEQGSQIGTAQGLIKRTNEVFIRVWNTSDIQYGIPGDMYDVPLDSPTTDVYLKMPPGYNRRYEVLYQSLKPLPCNLLGVALQGMGYD